VKAESAVKMAAVEKEKEQQEKQVEQDVRKEEVKQQQEVVQKAKADAQVEINTQNAAIQQEAKSKVVQGETQAKEDLGPMQKELDDLKSRTKLVKKQTKEMLVHGNTHFSQGLDKLTKLRDKHATELVDLSQDQKSVAAPSTEEDELNIPLVAGLAFTNLLTAGYAYTFYRSTKQMRNFHSSLMEF